MTNFGWWREQAYAVGQFICCLCFESLPIEQAWQDEHGQRWDVCPACGWAEHRARQANTPK